MLSADHGEFVGDLVGSRESGARIDPNITMANDTQHNVDGEEYWGHGFRFPDTLVRREITHVPFGMYIPPDLRSRVKEPMVPISTHPGMYYYPFVLWLLIVGRYYAYHF